MGDFEEEDSAKIPGPFIGSKQQKSMKLDVLLGVIVGISNNKGCTIRQLSSKLYWVPKKKLSFLLEKAVGRGLLRKLPNGQYKVRWEDENVPKHQKRTYKGTPTAGCKCYACEHWRSLNKETVNQESEDIQPSYIS